MRRWIVFVFGLIFSAPAAAQESGSGKPVSAVLVIVNENGNRKLSKISFSTLRRIYNCEIKSWKQVPGSNRTDPILAYASDEKSEVSSFFKRRLGKVQLANCVTVISGRQSDKIIATGLATLPSNSKVKEIGGGIGIISADFGDIPKGVRVLAVSDDNKKPSGPYVVPSAASIRAQTYPLAEKSGARSRSDAQPKAGRTGRAVADR